MKLMVKMKFKKPKTVEDWEKLAKDSGLNQREINYIKKVGVDFQ